METIKKIEKLPVAEGQTEDTRRVKLTKVNTSESTNEVSIEQLKAQKQALKTQKDNRIAIMDAEIAKVDEQITKIKAEYAK
jgi:hypothetical protein